MAISCPNCGAEVKKDFKFCLSCGYSLQTAASQIPPSDPKSSVTPTQESTSQQTYSQSQTYKPIGSGSKNIKMIVALIGVIIAVIVVVIVVFMLIGGRGGTSNGEGLVGTWQTTMEIPGTGEMTMIMKLNSDGTVEMGSYGYTIPLGTWSEENGQLCLYVSGSDSIPGLEDGETSQCLPYTLDGNTMTWGSGLNLYTWKKV